MDAAISSFLYQRFGSRQYWPELARQLRGWPPVCMSQPPEVVSDQEAEFRQSSDWQYSLAPFLSAVKEVAELRVMTKKIADGNELAKRVDNTLGKEAAELLKKSAVADDLVWFSQQLLSVSSPQQIVEEAHWIKDPQTHLFSLSIGPELQWLLTISRCLGLIKLETLRHLRQTKVRVLGASVAASAADLLASLGCEDISCVDPGLIELSNLPRLPMAQVQNVGCPKSAALVQHLLRRHPYGKFRAVVGQAVPNLTERGIADVTIDQFLADADVILEVTDDIQTKTYVQTVALQKKSGTPLLFIADLGVEPVVKVVRTDKDGKVSRPFGRSWTATERRVLDAAVIDSTKAAPAAYLMVKEDLPNEQALQFLLSCVGVMPFWSQTPVASRQSSALAALAILEELGGCTPQVPGGIKEILPKLLQLE